MFPLDSRILVIDDLRLVRRIISDILNDLGYKNIEEAQDGAEALDKINKSLKDNRPYQFIFCDWNMPVMDGYDFLLKVRAVPAYAAVPIVMVTAESEQANVLKAMKVGANDYIVKPISKNALHKKLARLAGSGNKPEAA